MAARSRLHLDSILRSAPVAAAAPSDPSAPAERPHIAGANENSNSIALLRAASTSAYNIASHLQMRTRANTGATDRNRILVGNLLLNRRPPRITETSVQLNWIREFKLKGQNNGAVGANSRAPTLRLEHVMLQCSTSRGLIPKASRDSSAEAIESTRSNSCDITSKEQIPTATLPPSRARAFTDSEQLHSVTRKGNKNTNIKIELVNEAEANF